MPALNFDTDYPSKRNFGFLLFLRPNGEIGDIDIFWFILLSDHKAASQLLMFVYSYNREPLSYFLPNEPVRHLVRTSTCPYLLRNKVIIITLTIFEIFTQFLALYYQIFFLIECAYIVHPDVCPSVCPSVRPSVRPSIHMSA